LDFLGSNGFEEEVREASIVKPGDILGVDGLVAHDDVEVFG